MHLSPGGEVTFHITIPRQDTYTAEILTDERVINEELAFNHHLIVDGIDWKVGSAPDPTGKLSKGEHTVVLYTSIDEIYGHRANGLPSILAGIKFYAGGTN